jgi:hypothetical protein
MSNKYLEKVAAVLSNEDAARRALAESVAMTGAGGPLGEMYRQAYSSIGGPGREDMAVDPILGRTRLTHAPVMTDPDLARIPKTMGGVKSFPPSKLYQGMYDSYMNTRSKEHPFPGHPYFEAGPGPKMDLPRTHHLHPAAIAQREGVAASESAGRLARLKDVVSRYEAEDASRALRARNLKIAGGAGLAGAAGLGAYGAYKHFHPSENQYVEKVAQQLAGE